MTKSFFVEFRLQGFAKQYANWVRAQVHREARRLRIRELPERRFVSHIALFGPARTNNLQQVSFEVERVGRNFNLVPFKIGGVDKFQNQDANWLYLEVKPSLELENLRNGLMHALCRSQKIINDTCKTFDHKPTYKFHASIGKFSPRDKIKFEKLFNYVETRCNLENFRQNKASIFGKLWKIIKTHIFKAKEEYPFINLYLLRITVLGTGSRIQSEYDLALKKLLSRKESLSKYWRNRTIESLKKSRA